MTGSTLVVIICNIDKNNRIIPVKKQSTIQKKKFSIKQSIFMITTYISLIRITKTHFKKIN